MKIIGLISGGKDSTYSMCLCVISGHQLVGLANLRPQSGAEEDSYMYQTVGQRIHDLFAEAMDLPLFRRTIAGKPLNTDMEYKKESEDEVEDLFQCCQTSRKTYHLMAYQSVLYYPRIRR